MLRACSNQLIYSAIYGIMRYHEFKSHAHRPRNATRICFIYQLWLINIIKACCISNIRTQIYLTFYNMSKNLCPQTGNGIV